MVISPGGSLSKRPTMRTLVETVGWGETPSLETLYPMAMSPADPYSRFRESQR